MNFRNKLCLIIASGILISCNNGPKVITEKSNPDEVITNSGIFSEENTNTESTNKTESSSAEGLHTVVVNEKLPAAKYIYLNVTEAGEQFWIAARNQEITIGNTYFYRNALLKTNFESKEYNRVFEKIYLISNLVSEDHRNNSSAIKSNSSNQKEQPATKETIPTHTEKITPREGSISIAEIVANPQEYEGKTVQLTGKCVKINPNIMDRNWIHLQDGSKNDYDFVITSNTFVPEGKIITISALVSLNRDFGAGYRYDLILENGTIIQQ